MVIMSASHVRALRVLPCAYRVCVPCVAYFSLRRKGVKVNWKASLAVLDLITLPQWSRWDPPGSEDLIDVDGTEGPSVPA